MHRIDGAGHVDHKFVAEDPATLRPPTEITDSWMNTIQEEVAGFIEWAGGILDKANNGQFTQYLLAKFVTQAGIQSQTYTSFTATGAAPNFVGTPTPEITDYATKPRFRVRFPSAGSGADYLNISALGNKALKQYDSAGMKVAAVIAANQLVDVEYDGVDMVMLDPLPQATVTPTSDPTFVDNSAKPVSTSWLRASFDALVAAAGFAYSFGANGFIKFPSWFKGVMFQWGTFNSGTVGVNQYVLTPVTLPIAFPNALLAGAATVMSVAMAHSQVRQNGLSGINICSNNHYTSSQTLSGLYLCIGY